MTLHRPPHFKTLQFGSQVKVNAPDRGLLPHSWDRQQRVAKLTFAIHPTPKTITILIINFIINSLRSLLAIDSTQTRLQLKLEQFCRPSLQLISQLLKY